MIQTQETADNQYLVDLSLFQGPMDLLLYLIKKDEIDIYDIPIAGITRQYLEYIDLLEDLNIEVAGEYILMAASLIVILLNRMSSINSFQFLNGFLRGFDQYISS